MSAGCVMACGSDGSDASPAGGGSGGNITGGTGATSGSSGASASGGTSSGGTSSGGASSGGTSPEGGAPPKVAEPMPLISRNVPAFSSTDASTQSLAAFANDGLPNTSWSPNGLPGWIAYDLSATPAEQREQVLVAWYGGRVLGYINDVPDSSTLLPVSYTIEINSADGGGAPPASGWEEVVSVDDNNRSARQHLVDLSGGNWIRMSVSDSTDTTYAALDLDVYSASNGASDCWLMMGDSITFVTVPYASSDIPALVNEQDQDRWPVVINAAIGGTNTGTAIEVIDETMAQFAGRFVTLNYGTNNHPYNFDMEALVLRVLAANKIPVVPHVPWSSTDGIQAEGPVMNQMIDELYEKYPEIVPGPDLWAAFEGRTDLIPVSDVHPNSAGQEYLREVWANFIFSVGE